MEILKCGCEQGKILYSCGKLTKSSWKKYNENILVTVKFKTNLKVSFFLTLASDG